MAKLGAGGSAIMLFKINSNRLPENLGAADGHINTL